MDAGYELPLPAAQIVERLNVRPRIPLSPWSLLVTSVRLLARPDQLPLVEVTATAAGIFEGETAAEQWVVRFAADRSCLEPGAPPQPFLLLLKVRLEDSWLNRHRAETA